MVRDRMRGGQSLGRRNSRPETLSLTLALGAAVGREHGVAGPPGTRTGKLHGTYSLWSFAVFLHS